MENFGGGKLWRIWRIDIQFAKVLPSKFYWCLLSARDYKNGYRYYEVFQAETFFLVFSKPTRTEWVTEQKSTIEGNSNGQQQSDEIERRATQ